LEFVVPAWSPWQEGDKEVLEKVQKGAVKMISGQEGKTYEERLKEVGLLTLEKAPPGGHGAKIVTGKDMVKSETWFQSVEVTGRATRSADDPLNVRPQACRLDTRRHFFSQRVVESWNSISSSLKQVETVRAFKNSYRDYRAMAEGTAR
jgi:ribonuclease P/MRP protein subunit RPP40